MTLPFPPSPGPTRAAAQLMQDDARRRAEALARQRLGLPADGEELPILDPSFSNTMLPTMRVTADAPHAAEAGAARLMMPDAATMPSAVVRRTPTVGETVLDVGKQFPRASAGLVSRLGEGTARTLANWMPDNSQAEGNLNSAGDWFAESNRKAQQELAPRTALGKMASPVAEVGVSALPYVAAGGGVMGLLRSAGLTAIESRAKDGSLVQSLADMTGFDPLKQLANSKYKTGADVAVDMAANMIPGAGAFARKVGEGVRPAMEAAGSSERTVRDVRAGRGAQHVVASPQDPVAQVFIQARNATSRPGFLSPLNPEDLVGRRVTLTNRGTTGFVLTPEGDLQNLFNNNGPRGAARELIFDGIRSGGRTLDAFDGYLPKLYSQYGFVETGRVPFNDAYAPAGWNFERDGRPDVVFMAYRGGEPEEVVRTRVNNSDEWKPHARTETRFDDYDLAARNNQEAALEFERARAATPQRGAARRAPTNSAGAVAGPRAGGDARGIVRNTLDDAAVRLAQLRGGAQQVGSNVSNMARTGAQEIRQNPQQVAALLALLGSEGMAPGSSALAGLPLVAGSTGRVPVEEWRPNSRGIFVRDGVPDIQGTLDADPRLQMEQYVGNRAKPSELVQAIANSKKVARVMDEDAERGLIMGGPQWYNLGPIRAFFEQRLGLPEFYDWNTMGSAASASNSVPAEISAASIINFARKNDMDLERAKKIAREMFKIDDEPGKLPLIYQSHADRADKGIKQGNVILPEELDSDAWKIPGYNHGRAGGGTNNKKLPGSSPAIDRHEKYRLVQAAYADRALRSLLKEKGLVGPGASLPLRNALDYRLISDIYVDGAKRMGLPTPQAYQASRWTGGFDMTGLQSPAYGDFVQAVEDMILMNAQQRRLKTDPKSLQNFFEDVARGKNMLMPWTKEGPIPIRPY